MSWRWRLRWRLRFRAGRKRIAAAYSDTKRIASQFGDTRKRKPAARLGLSKSEMKALLSIAEGIIGIATLATLISNPPSKEDLTFPCPTLTRRQRR